jgi:hypothetical protein
MCYEFELEYQLRRAEEARRELKKAEEQRNKPKPAAPAEAPKPAGQEEPVPV